VVNFTSGDRIDLFAVRAGLLLVKILKDKNINSRPEYLFHSQFLGSRKMTMKKNPKGKTTITAITPKLCV
jgi:hypothetical protein